jgi:predicted secreted protein
MNLFSAFVVWLIIWWLTLFIILPIGIRGQAEEGDVVEGTEPGAPHKLDIKKKFIQTTIIGTILWALTCGLIISGIIDWTMLQNLFKR